jgi:hypothetical protein
MESETLTHLCKDCTFSRDVWSFIKQWFGLTAIETIGMTGSLHKYWRKCRTKIDKGQRRKFDGIVIYFGGICGKNEIEEHFRTSTCSQDKWLSFARKI